VADGVRLTGDGVVLRGWEPRDLAVMVELFDEPEVARWTPLPSPFGPAEAAARLARAQEGEHLFLAITTDGDAPCGEVLLMAGGGLGYVLGAAHRGQGLAARAVALLRDHAHDVVGLPVVHLEIAPDNTASRAVARRTGFRLVAPAAEVVVDKGREVVLDRWEHRRG
jgi:RimJ/RimL family protein N-acetyltransferase